MFYARKYHLYRPAMAGRYVQPATAAFVPTDIAGLELWLDANDLTTLWQDSGRTTPVTADADPVGAWDDKSGNGRNVTQGTAGARPTYKTAIKNGRPVLRLDGGDSLTVASYNPGASFTRICVYTATAGYIYSDAAPGAATTYLYAPGGAHGSVTGPGGASQFDVTATMTGAWYILSQRCGGTHATHVLRGNGSDLTRGAVYATADPGDQAAFTLYAPSVLTGDVAEILFYDSVLSGADLARVDSYLNTKWAVY